MSRWTIETRIERLVEALEGTADQAVRRAIEDELEQLRRILREREPDSPPPLTIDS